MYLFSWGSCFMMARLVWRIEKILNLVRKRNSILSSHHQQTASVNILLHFSFTSRYARAHTSISSNAWGFIVPVIYMVLWDLWKDMKLSNPLHKNCSVVFEKSYQSMVWELLGAEIQQDFVICWLDACVWQREKSRRGKQKKYSSGLWLILLMGSCRYPWPRTQLSERSKCDVQKR